MNLPWKKVIPAVIGVVVVIAAVFYFNPGKSARSRITAINPAFGAYISGYTAGVVSSGSFIRIVLSEKVVDSSSVGKETAVKLFDFSPSVKGTSTWLDQYTVEFRPADRMLSGQVYDVTFFLSKVMTVPKDLSNFEYSFQVIPQNFELTVDNIKPYVKTELGRQKLEGRLFTADYADAAAVEKVIQASQESKDLKVSWNHSSEGKQHYFVVEDVSRNEKSSTVQIIAKGSALGTKQSEERQVEIPALGDFKVMSVRVEQSGNQHVVVQFSDPLNEKQSVAGLISLANLPSLDFEIKDNEIHVFPPVRQNGSNTLTIEKGIQNVLNYKLKEGGSFEIAFEQIKPAVRFTGKGSILPGTDGMVLPFEAVNLKAVDVEIVKVFESNVLQFLQVNDLDGSNELRRTGRPVLKKVLQLDNAGVADLAKWNRFTLDLSSLINTEPGAIYQVRLKFRREYLAYTCDGEEGNSQVSDVTEEDWSQGDEGEFSNWDSYEDYYYYGEGYDWQQRDNPCNRSYYSSERNVRRNVLASDLGLLAKRGGDGTTTVLVNNLKSTEPVSGAQLELYDYQEQLIASASTDAEGKAVLSSKGVPFVLVAKSGSQRGYLKLQDGESLSMSSFDVGGEQVRKGLKGFLYGERGVWRPGDSLYLSFILEDKLKLMPSAHPVVLELQNPQGQVANRIVKSSSENGFYKFATATAPDAPTGNWLARVKVGGVEFTQPIRIEMVKPNRLKINLDFGAERLTSNAITGRLKVNWLQGTPGKNLKAQFEVLMTKGETKFQRYPDFVFDDPSRDFRSETQSIFEGFTDENGEAKVNATLQVSNSAPGVLNAVFRGKVFEESGNFSIDRFSIPFYPYQSYTGIRLPQGDKARGMLLTDTTHTVDVVTVDADGGPVSHDNIEMAIYKLQWRWWWDSSGDNANYMGGEYSQPLARGNISTTGGKGSWKFRINAPEWGRYLVRAYDPVSGHSTAKIVYIDWPGWAGKSRGGNENATMLAVSAEKASYNVGEKVKLKLPGSDHGRALISVENGSRVLETFWLETSKGDNSFSFEVTPEMTPNIFVNVTLLQPHAQTENDLPIRLYGAIPIQIEDPKTHLKPVLTMADVLEPGGEVVIKVSEESKRKMTYTLAVVEEGLLDLTHFKTPDPWNRFYAREALGVKTWDLYDNVMGAFGGRIERLMAIGGDGLLEAKEDDEKANRFKPVIKFMGPFTLNGGTKEHRFVMPPYIGSVRAMIVAGYEGAYGNAEKAVPVRKPLMVLATLPRVLGPEEKVKLPITLFRMDKNISDVKVDVKVSGPVTLTQGSSRTVKMDDTDLTIDFGLGVKSETGFAKIEVVATSGSITASNSIDIEVRNPNPLVTKVTSAIIETGQSWNTTISPIGIAGTNSAVLEVSSLPPVNLGQRMKYLLQYPHGCIEQTTSSVFPQLYLDQVKVLTDAEKATIGANIKAGIERLKLFVVRDGGFAYWPGGEDSDSWGSTYAGHFLVEADAKGYFVPHDMIKRWKKFQKTKAQNWRRNLEYSSGELIQAYRLYTLALAGDADLGAMNRLREDNSLPITSSWMLAAAYVKAGQPEAARKLIANLPTAVKSYQEMAWSYGSDLRDEAIILETLVMMNERTKGFELVKEISKALSDPNNWMSTQTVAWCLKSVGSFAGTEKRGELKYTYSYNGKETQASTGLPIAQSSLPIAGTKGGPLKLVSNSQGSLFVRVITEGIPARGTEDSAEENLTLDVSYTDTDGNPIDPGQLEQGKEFISVVSVSNPGVRGKYENLALNQIFPSGWEINNLRLEDAEARLNSSKATYQDIRDDRVYTYFNLGVNERKTFRVLLTASYAGSFYLPAVSVEAMYDHSVYSRKKGRDVEVVKPATP